MKNKDFYRKLVGLVLPIAFQNFMLSVVSASDAVMLGFLDQDALSAVSLASQIQFIHSLFLMAFVIGTTILVAQYWGKKDLIAVEKIFSYVIKLVGSTSIIFGFATFIFPELLMRVFTAESDLVRMGAIYLRIVSVSYLLSGISQVYLCMLKNMEKAFKSTVISSATGVINIILNIIFIFGIFGVPALGIGGAAVATVIARAIELVWGILSIKKLHLIRLNFKFMRRPDLILKKDFWSCTTPVLGNMIVWGGGFTMFTVIMGHLGSDAVAANAIANIVKNLIVCVSLGIGGGGSIIIGNELGKGMLNKAKEYGGKIVRLSILCGVISGVVLLLVRPIILYFSALNKEATQLLSMMLLICAYYLIGKSVNSTVIGGIFCAGGDTKFGFLSDTITMWIIIIPFGLVAAFLLKLPVIAVYFILNLDEMIKLPAVYRHYKKYKWVKDLTRDKLVEEELS